MRVRLFFPLILAALALPVLSGCDNATPEEAIIAPNPTAASGPTILGPDVLCGQRTYTFNGLGTFAYWQLSQGKPGLQGTASFVTSPYEDPVDLINGDISGNIVLRAFNTAGQYVYKIIYNDGTC